MQRINTGSGCCTSDDGEGLATGREVVSPQAGQSAMADNKPVGAFGMDGCGLRWWAIHIQLLLLVLVSSVPRGLVLIARS